MSKSDWEYFEPGDKIKRLSHDYFDMKKDKVYTFISYGYTKSTIYVKEITDGSYYDSHRFIKVDLDIFNNLGD